MLAAIVVIGLGAHWVVESAARIAKRFGLSKLISLAALCSMVFLVLLFMRTGWRVSRFEGFVLVAIAASRWGLDLSARVPGS